MEKMTYEQLTTIYKALKYMLQSKEEEYHEMNDLIHSNNKGITNKEYIDTLNEMERNAMIRSRIDETIEAFEKMKWFCHDTDEEKK